MGVVNLYESEMIILVINDTGFKFLDEYEDDELEIVFSLEYVHSFSGSMNLIFAYSEDLKEEKEYFILYKKIFEEAKKIRLTNDCAQNIINIIENARISIKPPENFGVDGHYYIITVFNNGNFSQYYWWSEPDGDWKVFQELIDIIFDSINNCDKEN